MPITIKTGTMKYKDQNGNYKSFNAIAQEGTEEQLAQITAKGEEVLESIPEDYTALEGEVGELKSALASLTDGTPVQRQIIDHVSMVNGSYAANDTIGTPTGGSSGTRAVYGEKIALSVLDEVSFVFDSDAVYNISFYGFDVTGKCVSTPSTWLSDGTYTKAQVITNGRIPAGTVYFCFAIKKADGSSFSLPYADDYASILLTSNVTVSPNSIADGSITKYKLTQAIQAALDELPDLESDVTQLQSDVSSIIDGTQHTTEHIDHSLMIAGTYAANDNIGTPTGGGTSSRAVYGEKIALSLLDDANFVFASDAAYSVAFVGFDSTGKCVSTPAAWLSDGTYTKSQVVSNARITGDTAYFSFQVNKASGTITPPYADTYASLATGSYTTISPNSIADESIAENKLSQELQDKINGQTVDTFDVIMFMGQSNMAGRGEYADAPALIPGAGYEYRAISAPNQLSPMQEPFGATEANPSGIDEGSAKTGSMVVAFTNAYYLHNGKVPVVGISASKGGTPISDWQPGGAYLTDAISRLSSCVSYLTGAGYTIRYKYILWCQGETDGDDGTTAQDYKTLFDTMLSAMKAQGIEKLFMVRIGNYNSGSSTKYETIMDCQTEIAQTEADVVMASTDFAGMRARGLMKDAWHYYQAAYNEVGEYSGINVALYVNTGKEPTMYDTQDGSLYFSHKN